MSPNQLTARTLESLLGEWRTDGSAYTALADRIRLLTLDGRIPTDSRLPAERDLGTRLGLSRTTVTAAYRQLRDAGYLHSVQGSGSVARLPGTTLDPDAPAAAAILDLGQAVLPAWPGLAEVATLAAADLPKHLTGSGFDPLGIPELRRALAERYRARGLPTEPEQIMVTVGAQHAIALLARVLINRGDRVLIETPTYPHAYEALRAAGGRLMPVSVTADLPGADAGWDEPALVQTLERSNPVLGYLMPDFQNPTGQTMPVEQRERVLAAAARQGTVLISDETIGELDIDRAGEFGPFAASADPARPDLAITVGSVGKTVWGGLRVGWIRADAGLIRKLASARLANDLGTPVLEQLIVTRLLQELPGILESRRTLLRAGRDRLVTGLAERFPEWQVPQVHGGVVLWVNLGRPVSSQLSLAARAQGLLLPAGPRFGIDGAFERFLRIPFCYGPSEMPRALDALAEAWQSMLRHPLPDTGYLADVV
ncbi:PLP-dependent aminotransferase family protein [Cryobacterium arcticum]|uniref:PLP-dependent aminotransferase family protein n=1 Tax=Cryobacterium arcticum TaxID=670052 RepID=A0A317ZPM1_9MICO|nr:PLP-dependent aminotransferase family protein [Cryobacterium arcticum]PXA65676.1 PLP-dependent aminotransferase family protein [Cryobacterium arcticum]